MKGYLILEDGFYLQGDLSREIDDHIWGEVVFNTSMMGYQEIFSDPSYAGQMVVFTYPLIGNYGVSKEYLESDGFKAKAIIAREISDKPSNWCSEKNLFEILEEYGVAALTGVDTRALTKHLRDKGTMKGIITPFDNIKEGIELAQMVPPLSGQDFVSQVTCKAPYHINGNGFKVVVWDFGHKSNIIKSLIFKNCNILVVPAKTSAKEILSWNPQGIVLSNGPGDPKDLPYAVDTIKELLGKIPMMGICMGHQLLGLALGCKTYKMKFGHRGGNQPVKDLNTGKIYITSQNHGYAIDGSSVDNKIVEITHINLNDGTVEGIRHKKLPVFSVQYHPEGCPGPKDSDYIFEHFINQMKGE